MLLFVAKLLPSLLLALGVLWIPEKVRQLVVCREKKNKSMYWLAMLGIILSNILGLSKSMNWELPRKETIIIWLSNGWSRLKARRETTGFPPAPNVSPMYKQLLRETKNGPILYIILISTCLSLWLGAYMIIYTLILYIYICIMCQFTDCSTSKVDPENHYQITTNN